MSHPIPMHIIARIRSDFPTKFGIPRQSGLADTPARGSYSSPPTATPTRCAGSTVFPTCG